MLYKLNEIDVIKILIIQSFKKQATGAPKYLYNIVKLSDPSVRNLYNLFLFIYSVTFFLHFDLEYHIFDICQV